MRRQVLVTLAALSGLIALGAPPARAQFEIDPDHFEAPNIARCLQALFDVHNKIKS